MDFGCCPISLKIMEGSQDSASCGARRIDLKYSCLRLSAILLSVGFLAVESCNSNFQPLQVYSPQLVVYGIAFSGDSSIVIRVDANSRSQTGGSSSSGYLTGLSGTIVDKSNGETVTLSPEYVGNENLLSGRINLLSGSLLDLKLNAAGYDPCSASLTVLDSGIIYPAYFTTSVMQSPGAPGQPSPQFTIYPSSNTMAIRLSMTLIYNGTGPDGNPVSGEVSVKPSYQQDTTSYLLRIGGVTTTVQFNLSDYLSAYSSAVGKMTSGTVVAVVKLLQLDATLYDFYSISNGFNDPLTMRTEKPVFTNITGGLGFFGSAAEDSLLIQVYP